MQKIACIFLQMINRILASYIYSASIDLSLPKLQFSLDESIAYSVHIGKILNDLNITQDEPEENEEEE